MTEETLGSFESLSWGGKKECPSSELLEEFPVLPENKIYISHVGDGEYKFNVFGSAHRDMEKFQSIICRNWAVRREDVEIYLEKIYLENDVYFLVWKKREIIAWVTVAEIDPEYF
jgi:hypothetical protein